MRVVFGCLLVQASAAAIVRRSSAQEAQLAGSQGLCEPAKIQSFCTALERTVSGPFNAKSKLEYFMTASEGDIIAYLGAADLGDDFACQELCERTLAYAQSPAGGEVTLPPRNAVLCTDPSCEKTECVAPQTLRSVASAELLKGDVSLSADAFAHGEKNAGPNDEETVLTAEEPKPTALTFTPQELARSLLVLFDIFVVPDVLAPKALKREFLAGPSSWSTTVAWFDQPPASVDGIGPLRDGPRRVAGLAGRMSSPAAVGRLDELEDEWRRNRPGWQPQGGYHGLYLPEKDKDPAKTAGTGSQTEPTAVSTGSQTKPTAVSTGSQTEPTAVSTGSQTEPTAASGGSQTDASGAREDSGKLSREAEVESDVAPVHDEMMSAGLAATKAAKPVPVDLDPHGLPASELEVAEAGINDPEFGPQILQERYKTWTMYAAKGAALVAAAIKRVDASPAVVKRWFGEDASTDEVRSMFQKQLKTILDLKIKKGTCQGTTLAYVLVWTNSWSGDFVRSDRDERGQYVVHVCDYFWDVVKDKTFRYGTLIHEAAHHHGPTDVVLQNGRTAYGRRNNLELVKEQGAYGDGFRDSGALNNADNYMTAVMILAENELKTPLAVGALGDVEAEHGDVEAEGFAEEVLEWEPLQKCSTPCGAKALPAGALDDVKHDQPLAGGSAWLEVDECARCEWTRRKRFFGKGCGRGHSIGLKAFFNKVCCYKEKCALPGHPDV